MLTTIFVELGAWSWFILGLLLLLGEVVLPGVFLVWFGAAALTVGTLTLAPFTDVSWWPWQAQLVAFAVLSLIFVFVGRKLFPSGTNAHDAASRMNDPLGRMVGREAVLTAPIESGVGRVKLGDTTWRVEGPALAAGERVRVIGVRDEALLVEKA